MKLNLLLGAALATFMGTALQAQNYTQTCTPSGQETVLLQAGTNLSGNDITVNADVPAKPAAANALVLDVWFLDNSFNLFLNKSATPIFSSQLQFQSGDEPAQNVNFVSGGSYEDGTIPSIWSLGSLSIDQKGPTVVSIILKDDGTVSLYGIKQNVSPLEPLELQNVTTNLGASSFNSTAANNVLVSQMIIGNTTFASNVYWTNDATCSFNHTMGTNEVNFRGFTYNSMVNDALQMKSEKNIQGVKIYNMTGQLVRSAQPNRSNTSLNLQDLQSGIYVMNVTIDGATKAYKIVKK